MKTRHIKNKSIFIKSVSKIALFVLLSFAAIKGGTLGGNLLSRFEGTFVGNIDVHNFKSMLNNSFPIIDSVYNSGNISVSLYGEIKGMISRIFGFDFSSPETVLNSNLVILSNYYIKDYPDVLLNREKQVKLDYSNDENAVDNEKNGLLVDQSSIYTEEDEVPGGNKENKDNKKNNIGNQSQAKIAINNDTDEKIAISELLKAPISKLTSKKGPKVLIYHTHTTESYIDKISNLNKTNLPSWSKDPQKGVVRVGEQLASILRKSYGIDVIHNGTIHDYPDYNSSYANSLKTASSILKSYPSINVIIDLHRDGLAAQGKKLRAVKEVNGKKAAQVMFVMGTNKRGLYHPNWKENLKFALKLQDTLNKICPGLAKPINLSINRYNQHVSNKAIIIEVGGDGNLMEECLESTKYLAQAINEVVKN
ncbi:stage II sporulation protein P [Pseudobacteroides cellulosolvens]|uniref:Stage II sporulation protein P n=1 Tax=Pseudobacteroides cellulosolvens ATCC 35603 = DSM 2933 TaxID=398512 RepID=A0A0L6JQN3_9FIRM|nr:stage II sporulation protein P [Pseudobacteroides cellulosolvens]KNY28099.1 stage II sporulation protein P [Pseudobacteroides cellulosolvens ATCC 35603 = DSM 2933]